MLALINTNRMMPLIAPIALDYVAAAARRAGIGTDVVDPCLAREESAGGAGPPALLERYLAASSPELVGISFRNVDDCFWPSAQSFLPDLARTLAAVRSLTDAPIVLGGVGFSIFAEAIVQETGADFGIRGDGEEAIVRLIGELRGRRRFEDVPGLIWRQDAQLRVNPPAWPALSGAGEAGGAGPQGAGGVSLPTGRDAIDNATYFRLGGQVGLETKRGCPRRCIYCADPLAKGPTARPRNPREVADEAESLLAQGVDVLHLCDSEFNLPREHAMAVCEEFIRRSLGERVRWYAYLAVVPFDAELASAMRRSGCAGIDFTGDTASPRMLAAYRHRHGREDLAAAVRLCRENGLAVMIDLLLGAPGESEETAAATIDFLKHISPDCAGAALGVRLYPGTPMIDLVASEGPLQSNPGIRRRYSGPIDLLEPTFYVSPLLGARPAGLIRDLIAGDPRFFEPADDAPAAADSLAAPQAPRRDHNYNDNTALVQAIAAGARGAYWDILRKLRSGG